MEISSGKSRFVYRRFGRGPIRDWTGNPEAISSLVGLVPTNPLLLTGLLTLTVFGNCPNR